MAATSRTSCAGQPFRGSICAWLRHYRTNRSATRLPLCQALVATRESSMIENEKNFFDWLDHQLDAGIPNNIVAFNINIYESPFHIEIVGSAEYDPENEDWACNEDWVPKNRMSQVSESLFGDSWKTAESNIIAMAKTYFGSNSKNATKLQSAKAFVVGFVDGNLNLIQ